MKYVNTKLRQLVAIGDGAEIVSTPDDGELPCLKVGDRYVLPFIGWMSYDPESGSWIELDTEGEEELLTALTDSYTLEEISDKEAGEKFSDDIEFIE